MVVAAAAAFCCFFKQNKDRRRAVHGSAGTTARATHVASFWRGSRVVEGKMKLTKNRSGSWSGPVQLSIP